jgi:hypothetical protein
MSRSVWLKDVNSGVNHNLPQKTHNPNYNLALVDSSLQFPMCLTQDLLLRLDSIRKNSNLDIELAQNVYNYLHSQISYDYQYVSSGNKSRSYADSIRTWRDRKGVCGEMAYLYVASARYVGLESAFVHVDTDYSGRRVHHACAGVFLQNYMNPPPIRPNMMHNTFFSFVQDVFTPFEPRVRQPLLVDIAYNTFNIHHMNFKVMTDFEVLSQFREYQASYKAQNLFPNLIRRFF